ncbi:MAG: GNA1162 family protein, partial [Candidatus Tectimicrobiota bacterium]
MRRWMWLLAVGWTGGLVVGCQASVGPRASTKTTFDHIYELTPSVNAYVDRAFFTKTPHRVAVLPFVYRPRPTVPRPPGTVASPGEEATGPVGPSPQPMEARGDRRPVGSPSAGRSAPGGFSPDAELVRRAFYGQFATLAFSDVDLHEVDRRLQEARAVTAEQLEAADPQWLGRLLDADALLYGTVHEMSVAYLVLYSQIAIGVSLQLVSAADGTTLWRVDDVGRKHNVHLAFGPVGLIAGAIRSGMALRPINITRTAEDLSRDIVQTFPTRASLARLAGEAYEILAVEADGTAGPKRYGDVVSIRVTATPGRRAWFDLTALARTVPLQEVEAGLYTGRYVVGEGDVATRPTITVYLGPPDSPQYYRWVRKKLRFRIDSIPPHPPTGLQLRREGRGLMLLWVASPSRDSREYRLYRKGPTGLVEQIGTTTSTSYLLAGPSKPTSA